MIEIKNLNKNYKTKKLIQDLSLTIHKNQLTSLIGPNGAGKSTVLNMAGRLLPYDSGQILIDGTDIEDWDSTELAKKMAIMKQSNPLDLQISVRELMAFGRFPHSKGRLTQDDQQLIDESLEYLNLTDLQDKKITELSGGQLQRAFIGMVICQDTDYILLDEPLNNLDINHSIGIMNLLRRLVDEKGKTIVVVMHDINYASQFSDRIIAMKDGMVFANDEANDVFQKNIVDDLFDIDVEIIEYNLRKYCIYYGNDRNNCDECLSDREDVKIFHQATN